MYHNQVYFWGCETSKTLSTQVSTVHLLQTLFIKTDHVEAHKTSGINLIADHEQARVNEAGYKQKGAT